jgi:hypothetical protein
MHVTGDPLRDGKDRKKSHSFTKPSSYDPLHAYFHDK